MFGDVPVRLCPVHNYKMGALFQTYFCAVCDGDVELEAGWKKSFAKFEEAVNPVILQGHMVQESPGGKQWPRKRQ